MVRIVSEGLVDRALVASGVVAWRWDIEAGLMDWSPGAEELIGLPDIVLRSPDLLMRAIHPDDLPLVSGAYTEALRRGGPMDARFRIVAPSGTRWFDCAGRATLDESGRALTATGTLVDVTEEAEAEDALLQTLRDSESVLQDVAARLWEWNPDTDRIHYPIPPAGPPILAGQTEGVRLAALLRRVKKGDVGFVRESLRSAVTTGATVSFETTVRDDDGIAHRVFVRGGRSSASARRLSGVSILLD